MALQTLRCLLFLALFFLLSAPTATRAQSVPHQVPPFEQTAGDETAQENDLPIQIDMSEVDQPPGGEQSKVRSYGLVLALVCSVIFSLTAVLGSIAIKRRLDRM